MAACVRRVCSLTFRSSTFLNIGYFSPISNTGRRYLLSREVLGLDGYQNMRNRTEEFLGAMKDKFCSRMETYLQTDASAMVFTEDLKSMVSLATTDTELELVMQMIKRFHSQNNNLRFSSFVFGPVIMRLLYYLDKPNEALAAISDKNLEGFFDQYSSYVILLDLCYKHKRYQDMLNVYDILHEKNLTVSRYLENVIILIAAACYQLNTPESYQYALTVLKDRAEVGREIARRSVSLFTSLALRQNDPKAALEILSLTVQSNYITVRNLKAMIFADLDRPEEAFPLIGFSLNQDIPFNPKQIGGDICMETIDKLKKSIERSGDKELRIKFDQIYRTIEQRGLICKLSLDQLLTQDIAAPSPTEFRRSRYNRSSEQHYKKFSEFSNE